MYKNIAIIVVGLSVVGWGLYHQSKPKSEGLQLGIATFKSIQVGSAVTAGDILTTDGTDSSWVTGASLGLGGGAGDYPFTPTLLSGIVYSATTSPLLLRNTITSSSTVGNLTAGVINATSTAASSSLTNFSFSAGQGNTLSISRLGLTGGIDGTGVVSNTNLANSSITVTTASPLGGAGTIALGDTLALTCTGCLTSLAGAASSTLLTDFNTFSSANTFLTTVSAGTSFLPDTAGGATLGTNGLGFSSLWLDDTSSVFELAIQSTSGMAGDQTLTFNVGNYSPTLIFSPAEGNPTLGDWFNQNVKTTGSPTFANLTVSTSTAGCATFSSSGVLYSTGVSCGTGGGTNPFETNTSWGALMMSTTSRLAFPESLQSSSTIGQATIGTLTATSTVTIPSLTSALIVTGAGGLLAEYTGIDCTNQFVRDVSALGAGTCATIVAADVDLADLTATDGTLTFSGAYDGQTARTIGLNLTNANSWTGGQTFINATSTGSFYQSRDSYLASSSVGQLTVGALISTSTTSFKAGSIATAALAANTISGVALGSNLNALTNDTTLLGSSYNGSGAISDWGIDLANPNTWTGLITYNAGLTGINATSSGTFYSMRDSYMASSSIGKLTVGAITATSSLTLVGAATGCATFTTGVLSSTGVACGSGGGSDPFTHSLSYNSATTSLIGLGTTTPWGLLSIAASSTPTLSNFPLLVISTSTSNSTSTAVIVDNNGRFGVGTSSPSGFMSLVGNFFQKTFTNISNAFRITNSSDQIVFNVDTTAQTGLGIGTTSPVTMLAVTGDITGQHLYSTSTAPTISSCGTSPSVAGSDGAGKVTIGSTIGVDTSCVATFALVWKHVPSCVATNETSVLAARQINAVTTLTTVTFNVNTAFSDGDVISYICQGW